MPDQHSAATEHSIMQEITGPLETLPDDAMPVVADSHFPIALRGYDRDAVDEYVHRTSQLVAELQATRSPEAAVRRALQRVGEEVSGILQRAHETAEEITAQSRREAEERLERERAESASIRAQTESRVRELDLETDRIWAERQRIIDDARTLAAQLVSLAEAASSFAPEDEDELRPPGPREDDTTVLPGPVGGAAPAAMPAADSNPARTGGVFDEESDPDDETTESPLRFASPGAESSPDDEESGGDAEPHQAP